jgi:hypothetical protein
MTAAELNTRLDSYLAIRNALGFRIQAEGTLLHSFVQFLELKGNPHPIRAYLAIEWACSSWRNVPPWDLCAENSAS